MKKMMNKIYGIIAFFIMAVLFITSGGDLQNIFPSSKGNAPSQIEVEPDESLEENNKLDYNGSYSSKEDVSMYLFLYGELPENFITKNKAKDLGWEASKGNLFDVTDKMSIGGDRFFNREGLLPVKAGRTYYEADIDYNGGSRGAKRIVYSNDGLVYYTGDHYDSFEKLYGEE